MCFQQIARRKLLSAAHGCLPRKDRGDGMVCVTLGRRNRKTDECIYRTSAGNGEGFNELSRIPGGDYSRLVATGPKADGNLGLGPSSPPAPSSGAFSPVPCSPDQEQSLPQAATAAAADAAARHCVLLHLPSPANTRFYLENAAQQNHSFCLAPCHRPRFSTWCC